MKKENYGGKEQDAEERRRKERNENIRKEEN